MKTVSKELILDLKVSTHDFKESTHVDSGHMELKYRYIETETKLLKSNDQESTHDTGVSPRVNRGQSLVN